ncbi:MAG TPA: ATP-binding protein [Myxococcaceae bacterium]|nr:ATP-binding protein [Myxococcaceae bacterium]
MVIFVGAQGSGKTTLYRERFEQTHLHISKDLLPRSADKRRRQRQLIQEALEARRSIVVDNTNASREDRAELIAQGRAHGVRVVAYYFDAPLADCLRRNALREGAARVPRVAVVALHKRLQPPSLAEGYDALYVARMVEPEGSFEISRVR